MNTTRAEALLDLRRSLQGALDILVRTPKEDPQRIVEALPEVTKQVADAMTQLAELGQMEAAEASAPPCDQAQSLTTETGGALNAIEAYLELIRKHSIEGPSEKVFENIDLAVAFVRGLTAGL